MYRYTYIYIHIYIYLDIDICIIYLYRYIYIYMLINPYYDCVHNTYYLILQLPQFTFTVIVLSLLFVRENHNLEETPTFTILTNRSESTIFKLTLSAYKSYKIFYIILS